MAHLTEVVLLLILATATFASDFDNIVKEAQELQVNSECSTCCPFGWVKYESRCFIYQGTSVDWASAEKHCLNLDAHLVSLHSENEYQLVKALIRSQDFQENPTWIGLSGCQKRNNFFWSDGAKLTFTKWNRGEPNFLSGECCAHMNWNGAYGSKDWNDIPCDQRYPFVCAKRFN